MISLLDVVLLESKLKKDCLSFEGRVFATIPDKDLQTALFDSPLLFVYESGGQSGQNKMGKGPDVIQHLTVSLTTECFIRAHPSRDDPLDKTLAVKLKAYREEVFNSLIAYRPAGCLRVITHSSGEINVRNDKGVSFKDKFTTEVLIKGEQ